jgi:protein-disulfide isomerase
MLPNAFAADNDALFQYDGLDYVESDLSLARRQELYQLDQEHFQNRQRMLDDVLVETHLEAEAERRELSKQEVMDEFFAVEIPDETVVRAFYDENKARIRAPYEQVKDRIGEYLVSQQVEARKAELVEELRGADKYKLLIARPEPPLADIAIDGRPAKGEADAPVVIVEFSDFQCPHCKQAAPVVEQVADRFPGKVRVVHMDFPVNPSGISRRAAEGGVCAEEQGQFWAYHDMVYVRQDELSNDSPMALAKELGLDETKFEACMASPDTAALVQQSEQEGRRLGVDSTPTFYLNGQRLVMENLERDLNAAIEEALAQGS